MNVSNDTPPMDYVNYYTKQLPIDLANMTSLRDELALRQGAITAVQDAANDRAAAKAELDAARASAADLLSNVYQQRNTAQDLASTVASDTAALITSRDEFFKYRDDTEANIAKRIASAEARAADLDVLSSKLAARSAQLDKDTQALEARVKSFQEKVAGLSA
jgi:chromosome segregation ATPase